MRSILIAGGSGLLGTYIQKTFRDRGYQCYLLSRSSQLKNKDGVYNWDPSLHKIDPEALNKADILINLAGSSIGTGRWSAKKKKEIVHSRLAATKLLFDSIQESDIRPEVYISASAIGYYGSFTSEQIFKEEDPPADDFLGVTCRLWEEGADSFSNLGIRTVKLRIGVVLESTGGALKKMAGPVKKGFGAAIGTGRQYIPWIHPVDLAKIFLKASEDSEIKGAYNAVSPVHLTNSELTSLIANALDKKIWFPNIPSILIKIVLGEMATLVLDGSRVSSQKIIDSGFNFEFSDPVIALENIFGTKT